MRNKHINIRNAPSKQLLNWRKDYLQSIHDIEFEDSYLNAPLLEAGNSKIGYSSKYYNRVFVWNLPVVITCPNASLWCLQHCYNADLRTEKFPIKEWYRNLQFYLKDKEKLAAILLQILEEPTEKKAVRIHSSGDFFEKDYIIFWQRIIEETPEVKYWAYTRSWVDNSLINALEQLRRLSNIQLFASWDDSMPEPPRSWRKSIVYEEQSPISKTGIVCPEQSGKIPDCASCNYCINETIGDVYFALH